MPKELLFARHGQTFGNLDRVIEGWLDGKLTSRGEKQAHSLGENLLFENVDLIISGDLGRQKETTEIVNQYLKKNIYFTHLLRERSAGKFNGISYDCVGLNGDIHQAEKWYRGFIPHSNQETVTNVIKRANTLYYNLSHMQKDKVLLIGSSWINSYLLNLFLEKDKSGDKFLVLREQDNASFHRLILDYKFNVLDYELNIQTTPKFDSLDRSIGKGLKPGLLHVHHGPSRKTG